MCPGDLQTNTCCRRSVSCFNNSREWNKVAVDNERSWRDGGLPVKVIMSFLLLSLSLCMRSTVQSVLPTRQDSDDLSASAKSCPVIAVSQQFLIKTLHLCHLSSCLREIWQINHSFHPAGACKDFWDWYASFGSKSETYSWNQMTKSSFYFKWKRTLNSFLLMLHKKILTCMKYLCCISIHHFLIKFWWLRFSSFLH